MCELCGPILVSDATNRGEGKEDDVADFQQRKKNPTKLFY